MKNKFLLLLVAIFGISIFTTGCDTSSMDGIDIMVTDYSNEYIVNRLYGNHSTITSIYPDGVNPEEYKITSKLKKEFAKKDLFIYNGAIDKERELATDLLEINPRLKIIDASYVLEVDNSPVELWLNPSSLLMMSENIKSGLEEYINSTYLQKDINANFDALQIEISELDVEYRDAVKDANSKTIVVGDKSLKYLSKFGLDVYVLDDDSTEKEIAVIEDLFNKDTVTYIIKFKGDSENENVKNLMNKDSDIKIIDLHKLDNINDDERDSDKTYLSIMEDNLSKLNQELYN